MKKFLKIILGIIGTLYLLVILFATVCLLCYNQYKVTQINDKTFIIIDDKSDMYEDGDLAIFVRNPNDEIVSGDVIFFYTVTNGVAKVNSGTVTKSEKITDTETTFTINDSLIISSGVVIGKTETATIYHNVGKILYVFESQYGFLILVILPALLLFFYAIYRVVKEVKGSKDDEVEIKEDKKVVPVTPTLEETVQPTLAPQAEQEVLTVQDQPVIKEEPVQAVQPEVKEEPAQVVNPQVQTEQTVVLTPQEKNETLEVKTEENQITSNDDIEQL